MFVQAQIGYSIEHSTSSTSVAKDQISLEPISELFAWTLSHSIVPFSNIQPKFATREEILDYVVKQSTGTTDQTDRKAISFEISRLALEKMSMEWIAWVQVHLDSHFDEYQLDNMLMRILYRFILNRDYNQCILCSNCSDLTIHHIIRKQRNNVLRTPPFGRSVPTNLVTLCRNCHSMYDPYNI